MHILDSMASSTRLRIDKPYINPKFYPLDCEKYIVIQGDAKFNSRKYDYFNEVIYFLKPLLSQQDIKIIQLGGANDKPVNGIDINLCGKTNYNQSFYIVQNALLTVGVDSLLGHVASAVGTKAVVLFSNMYVNQSKPYWSADNDLICIQAPLGENKPSYNAEENPKTINGIKPEEIVAAICKLLNLENTNKVESLYFGDKYNNTIIDVIPDYVVGNNFYPEIPLYIRCDYLDTLSQQNEQMVYAQLANRKCFIVSNKPLNINVLNQLRANLLNFIFEITSENHLEFIKQLSKTGIPYTLISKLPLEELQKIKLDYSDYGLIQHVPILSKPETVQSAKNTLVKTNKVILSGGKVYHTKSHWKLNIPISVTNNESFSLSEVEDDHFWNEVDWYYIYNKLE